MRSLREVELELGSVLAGLAAKRAFLAEGCSSIGQFGRALGLEPVEVASLIGLDTSAREEPPLAEDVRTGRVTAPAAAAVAPMLCDARLTEERGDWLERARAASLSSLRRDVGRRRAELRAEALVIEVTVFVPQEVDDGFRRARTLASAKAGRVLTRSETFAALVNHYLDSFDSARKAKRPRRATPTSERPHARDIPASVRDELEERSEGRCEFPGCTNVLFLEHAHWNPHADGGDRESTNLMKLCHTHHTMMDQGHVERLGTPEDPVFVTQEGLVLTHEAPHGRRPRTRAETRAARRCSENALAREQGRIEHGGGHKAGASGDRPAPRPSERTPLVRPTADGVSEECPAYDSPHSQSLRSGRVPWQCCRRRTRDGVAVPSPRWLSSPRKARSDRATGRGADP